MKHTKSLYLVRHAKAASDNWGSSDKARELTEDGMKDADRLGERLATHRAKIDLLICSGATRTQATAHRLAKKIGYPPKAILVDESLYASSPSHLLECIRTTSSSVHSLMLVGHNPELTHLARSFSNTIVEMHTCALVQFEFHAPSWATIDQAAPLLVMHEHCTCR